MKRSVAFHIYYLVIVSILVIVGCGTLKGPLFKPVSGIPENKSVIYIYRLNDRANTEFLIKYNNEDICVLKNNGYFPFFVDLGKVIISSTVQFKMFATGLLDAAIAGSTEFVLKAESGKSYYLKCVSDDVTSQTLNINLVPENFGMKNITACKLLESNL